MRIRCPSCSATYEVPDALLDPPRTVRCARCANDWTAVAVADDPLPEMTVAPVEAAEIPPKVAETEIRVQEQAQTAAKPRPAEPRPTFRDTPLPAIERLAAAANLSPAIRRRDHLLTAAWAASFAVLAALGVAAYTQRDVLMRQWPASQRVYAALGLAPPEMTAGDAGDKDAKSQPEDPARR